MKLFPARRINGRIGLPGDKSISHRAALIASLANDTARLTNFSTSEDCASTLACIEKLGATVTRSGEHLTIEPAKRLQASSTPLDCGNSGSTMRMLAGLLAGQTFTSTLVGDDSLSSRPMKRIIEPLERMGARIDSANDKPPLTIQGTAPLQAIKYELPVASAQVKSCVLFAGLNAEGQTTVIEPAVTRDHTERLFNGCGVPVNSERTNDGRTTITIDGPARFDCADMTIPGDISSAAYFVAAATLLRGSELLIQDVSLNPTRVEFLSVLRDWGAEIETSDERLERNEPTGAIRISSGDLESGVQSRRVPEALIPSLIDELPLMAVVGSQLPGGVEIRSATELRVKETDRIAATVRNLRAMGAEVEEYPDGLFVNGPTNLHGALIESYGDHRIAMAFSIAALVANGPSEISGASCVNISFPEFFELLHQINET